MKRHKRRQSSNSPAGRAAEPEARPNRPGPVPASRTGAPKPSKNRTWLLALLLFGAVIVAYLPATRGGFIWDDDAYVSSNPLLTAPDGWQKIWFSRETPSQYFPLVYSMFRIERHFWGLNPAGYHWVNVILHGINALLLWRLLRQLKIPGCWLAAVLFALHPVNVESVAWITERKNVLSLFFCLLAALAWVRFLDGPAKKPWVLYLAAIAFQMLALFSKTTACTLPVALLLILWWKRISINGRRIAQIVPFALLGLVMGLVTMWWEKHNMGALDKVQALTLGERLIVAGHAVWFYLGKLLWPSNLTFSYPRWTLHPGDPLAYGWLVALAVVAGVIWYARRRLGRGPETAAIFYVATLGPLLGFFMLVTFRWSFVADHYQYVASIGPFALAAAGITLGIAKLSSKRQLMAKAAVTAVFMLMFGFLVTRQCAMYANLETLWRVTLERNPASWLAHVNLGNILLERKQFDAAFDHYRRAETLNPSDANVAYNIGNAYNDTGDTDLAVAYFQKALWLQPHSFDALNQLAPLLLQRGLLDEAILRYQTALQVRPNVKENRHNYGVALLQAGRVDEAILQFKKVLEQDPSFIESHKSLGNAYLRKGRTDDAVAEYEKAVAIQPGNAATHDDFGNMLLTAGRIPAALAQIQKAIELQPGFPSAYADLNRVAWTLATSPDDHVRNGAKALELSQQISRVFGTRDPVILQTLAAAYAEIGRFSDAVATGERAVQLAGSMQNTALADELSTHLDAYQDDRPYRDYERTRNSH